MKEVWKDYPIDDDYLVSNYGKVMNKKTHRILRVYYTEKNYCVVAIKSRPTKLHRIIAKVFISNPENKPQVNHKDGNKLNNRADNLEWSTNTENQIHAYSIGLKNGVFLSSTQKHDIKQMYIFLKKIGNKKGLIAIINWKYPGVSKASIYRIINDNYKN